MTAAAEGGTSPGRVFSVTALTQSIRKNLLSNNAKLAGVWIEGEVSGNRKFPSGHRYFALKDANATISCVLFAFNVGACDEGFRAALRQGESSVDGLKVQAQGEIDLNMSRGQYSFSGCSSRRDRIRNSLFSVWFMISPDFYGSQSKSMLVCASIQDVWGTSWIRSPSS